MQCYISLFQGLNWHIVDTKTQTFLYEIRFFLYEWIIFHAVRILCFSCWNEMIISFTSQWCKFTSCHDEQYLFFQVNQTKSLCLSMTRYPNPELQDNQLNVIYFDQKFNFKHYISFLANIALVTQIAVTTFFHMK